MWWILDENDNPVRETDREKIEMFFKSNRRLLKIDFIDDVKISTVFLCLDHSFLDGGLPLLYETMIFGGKHDLYQERYTTKTEAIAGHKKALDLVNNSKLSSSAAD